MSADEDRDPVDQADASTDSDSSAVVDAGTDEEQSSVEQGEDQMGEGSDGEQQQDGVLGQLSALESEGAEPARKGREYVSFRVGHKVAPNKYVARRYLEEYDKVAIMWNEESTELLLMPLTADQAEVVKQQRPEQKLHNIQFEGDGDRLQPLLIKNDVKEFDLDRYVDVDLTQRFESEWDEETGVIRVDMSQDPEVVNS